MTSIAVEFRPDHLVSAAKKAALAVLLFGGIVMAAHCGTGCALFEDTKAPTQEQLYTTAIVACAATAGYPGAYDRQADMRCRAKVDCDFQLPNSGCGTPDSNSADGGSK